MGSLEWYKAIKKDESKWSTKRLIEFCLKKAESDETWPYLSKAKKVPWHKIDWNRWADSDDEAEKGANFDVNGMGDMNFGDMGGDDFDSDDEDLPDLEPPQSAGGDAA